MVRPNRSASCLLLVLLAGCAGGGSALDCDQPVERWADADGDGFGAGTAASVCPGAPGYAERPLDCDDADPAVNPDAIELCNGRDDDCNGVPDDGLDGVVLYTDADGDGYGVRFPAQVSCLDPTGGWSRRSDDCDDTRDNVHPGANEICNGGIDDDCSGLADDADPDLDLATASILYRDLDVDGFGDPDAREQRCEAIGGYVPDGTDCDDARRDTHPGANEVCNDRDDDCDGLTDDLDPSVDPTTQTPHYEDLDADGFGNGAVETLACTVVPGISADNPDDCDDSDATVSPADPERLCDEVDNDCDAATLDDPDIDLDGWTACGGDCNDANAAISPDAIELPDDGVDQNCNALEACYVDADEDGARTEVTEEVADRFCTAPGHAPAEAPLDCDDDDPDVDVDTWWYADLDGDGYGAGAPVVYSCLNPGGGLVRETEPLDCADDDPDHSPATVEICDNGVDEDCDLQVDCDDPSCFASDMCLGPCGDVLLASVVPVNTNGNTTNQGNDLGPTTCAYSNAPEVVLKWTPPADGNYTIDLQGSVYDTVLYVLDGCGGNEIACNDDYFGLQSMVQVQATAGQPLYIVVDGYSSGSGAFVLNIQ